MKNYINQISNTDLKDTEESGKLFSYLVEIMDQLRSKNGCIWDLEQTHESIKRNLLEEAYEAAESIEEKRFHDLKEELGDILLQVVFHSKIASDNNNFNINDVLKAIIEKLIRRHPHVFAKKTVNSSQEVLSNWESIKKSERKEKNKDSTSIFANIPKILPALHFAYEIQTRASRIGFDWDNLKDVAAKIKEETGELIETINSKNNFSGEELGDLLFSIVNISRHLKLDSEECLKAACKKFIRRFDFMEKYSEDQGIDFKNLSFEEKDRLWEMAKKNINDKF